ncbi:unnamed protein product [Agarophyton chilense]
MTNAWAETTPTERFFLDEVVPHNPVIITASVTLSSCPSEQWIFSTLIPRIVAHPRFSARIMTPPEGNARFESIPGFSSHRENLQQHHVVLDPVIDISLSHQKRTCIFQERLSQIISEPLPQHRPLWKIFFFPMWSIEPESQGKPCATIVFRIHHVIGDGMGLVKFFLSQIIDKDNIHTENLLVIPNRQRQKYQPHTNTLKSPRQGAVRHDAGWFAKLKHVFIENWVAFYTNLYAVVGTLIPEKDNVLVRSTLQPKKACALLPPSAYTVSSLKKAARALGITINDMLYTAVSGATRVYLTESGDDADGLTGLRCGVPFNKHKLDTNEAGELSNQFSIMSLPLHVHHKEVQERLRSCVRTMRIVKRGTTPALLTVLLKMVARLPRALRRPFWRRLTRSGSLLFTNVPGPRRAVCVGGIEVSGLHFFAPGDGHCGVVVGLHSYNERVCIGVYGDEGRISSPQRFVELLDEEIRNLVNMGDVKL